MADFSTHLIAASVVSSAAATVAHTLLGLEPAHTLALASSGIAGGLLPDVDLRDSHPTRLMFTGLGLLLGAAMLFSNINDTTAVEAWLMGIAGFVFVRFVLAALFDRFTVHRGTLHSLLGVAVFSIAATAASYHWLNQSAQQAWLLGIFVMIGCLVHLTLDEIYSVDFSGARLKRSFGSALKVLDRQRPMATVAAAMTCIGCSMVLPPIESLSDLFVRAQVGWQQPLSHWLLPTDWLEQLR